MSKQLALVMVRNAGFLRLPAVGAVIHAAAALILCGLALGEASAQSIFDDGFDSYVDQTEIARLPMPRIWASNLGSGVPPPYVPYISNPSGNAGVAIVPIRASSLPTAYLQPLDSAGNPINWPFARTSENFLRVEFELKPTLVTAAIGPHPDGVIGLYFTPTPQQGGFATTGPLAAVSFSWTSGNSGTAQIYAESPTGSVIPVGGPIDLGLMDVTRRLRVDYAWEYFTLPHDFQPPGSWPPSSGDPWVDLRLSWIDRNTGLWTQPSLGPGRNGWMEFGNASMAPLSYGGQQKTVIGFTRYDWTDSFHHYVPVFVHWYAAQGGGNGEVDWALDNVHISQVAPQAFSIMTNELGYDVAGHGWVAMRPNDPAVRALGQNAVATLVWTLHDSTGTTLATTSLNAPTGEKCFQEVTDPESPSGSSFPLAQLYWWRWEWPTASTLAGGAGVTGAFVTATGTLSGSGAQFMSRSDPFDVQPDIAYSTLINVPNNLASKNGAMRHAYSTSFTTPPLPPASAGWFDAGNENGENRSHGLFVSALCTVLKRRRSELSTQQIRDLVAEIRWGADFLLEMGTPENSSSIRQPNHAQLPNPLTPQDKGLAGHHLNGGTATQLELAGHVFHEHHSRRPAGAGDWDDKLDGALRIYLATLALYDSARTLRPFVQSLATTDAYFAQATDARAYLYNLSSFWYALGMGTGSPDFFLPYRSQAMLNIAAFDYSGSPVDMGAATQDMVDDLIGRSPTTAAAIEKWWVLGGMFTNAALGGPPDLSAYTPFEPLLEFVERGIADLPPTSPPHISWQEALDDIGEIYYHSTILPNTGNPLRITRNWPTDVDAADYWGDDIFTNHKTAEEAYANARLAQNATRAGANYDRFVQLATGDLNWILGLHHGVRSHHVQSGAGVVETDLEFSPASLIANVGHRVGIQVVYGLHSVDWTQPTTLNDLGGQISSNSPGSSNVFWPVAPFEFSRGEYGDSETFIKTDGNVLMAVEALGRVLHPRGIVEAENYSTFFIAAGGSPTVESDNEWNLGGPDRPNGGLSVVGLVASDWLQWNVMPPEPALTGSVSNVYNYTILVRTAYALASGTVTGTLTVSSPGFPTWAGSVSIPATGDKHEYVVVSTSPSAPVSLKSGVQYSIQLLLQGGPCSVDDLVLVSGGVMQ